MTETRNKGQFVKGHKSLYRRSKKPPSNLPAKPEPPHARQRAMRAMSARFLEDLATHYNEEGHHVFKIVFRENPETYFKALVALVPKELLINQTVNVYSELTDDQILEAIERMRRLEAINGNGLVIDG